MPKVSNVKLVYDDRHGKMHDIHYNKSYKFHVKDFPEEIRKVTGVDVQYYETEYNLIDSLQNACKNYLEIKKKSKLVILYKCEASVNLVMNSMGDGCWSGTRPGASKNIHSWRGAGGSGTGFNIDYKVCQKTDDGVKPIYRHVDPDSLEIGYQTTPGKEWLEIDYTEERLSFFRDIEEAMKQMINKLSVFFDMNQDQAQSFIEANKLLLKA